MVVKNQHHHTNFDGESLKQIKESSFFLNACCVMHGYELFLFIDYSVLLFLDF